MRSQQSAEIRADSSKQETKKNKLTIDQVFDAAEAGSHLRLLVSPGGALDLEHCEEVGLLRLRLLLSRLEMLCELRDQSVMLLG